MVACCSGVSPASVSSPTRYGPPRVATPAITEPSCSSTRSIGLGQKVLTPFQAISARNPAMRMIPRASAPPKPQSAGSPTAERSEVKRRTRRPDTAARAAIPAAPAAPEAKVSCWFERVMVPVPGSKLEGALAEALADQLGQCVDDEGHDEERERRQKQHAIVGAVLHCL